jgi:hypothetical protein
VDVLNDILVPIANITPVSSRIKPRHDLASKIDKDVVHAHIGKDEPFVGFTE